ncbi:UNKNOWN [Stylonychia lemnae]|uniref:Tetraspanin family protein n=1 Tax=Stylonychia lemnae TaxID=5949 RepID=A0A078A3V5_STYLE|nr:UNKNOWN [Stylonychia lemnae]|eukprot:CDW76208.1 UNKNOWN [Stylonychia lemnae]
MFCFCKCKFGCLTMTSAIFVAMALKLLPDNEVWSIWGQNGSLIQQYQLYIMLACAGLALFTGIQGAIMSRMYFAQCVCIFAVLSLGVGLLFCAVGAYFFGMYFATSTLLDTFCAGKASSVQTVRDYQVLTLDYYMLANLYVTNYMCSSVCPCISYSQLDPKKWGNNAAALKNNYVYTGTYTSFYNCLLDLQTKELVQEIPSDTLQYIIDKESENSCGGVCEELPMFYFFKPITDGQPPNSCKEYVLKDLQIAYLLYGSVFLFGGILLMIGFNVQYGMWGRNLQKKMEKTKGDKSSSNKYDTENDKAIRRWK